MMFRKNLAPIPYRYFRGGIYNLQCMFKQKNLGAWKAHVYAQKDMEHQSGEVSFRWIWEPEKTENVISNLLEQNLVK